MIYSNYKSNVGEQNVQILSNKNIMEIWYMFMKLLNKRYILNIHSFYFPNVHSKFHSRQIKILWDIDFRKLNNY